MTIIPDPNLLETEPLTEDELKPTRSEALDILCQVQDGVDGILLWRETSEGKYPLYCCKAMARICAEAESTLDYRALYEDTKKDTPRKIPQMETMASAAVSTTLNLQIDLIIVYTLTGKMARLVAKYKPSVPIFACTTDFIVFKNLSIVRGVIPLQVKEDETEFTELIAKA